MLNLPHILNLFRNENLPNHEIIVEFQPVGAFPKFVLWLRNGRVWNV